MNDIIYKLLDYISIFLAFMVILSVRDFFRALTAVKCGDITPKINKRLTLNPFAHVDVLGLVFLVLFKFGWSKPLPLNPYNFKHEKLDRIILYLVSIISAFLLAFLVYPLFVLSYNIPNFGYFTTVLQSTLFYIVYCGLGYMVFNLLPIYPLQGFEIIDLFCKRKGKAYVSYKKYGMILLYVLLFLSLISDLTGIYEINVLSYLISHVTNVLIIPINLFWGLIF